VILGHAIAIRETINNTVRVPHRYTTPWWLAGFRSSSARVECNLAVWMKPWGLSATYEIVTAAWGLTNLGSRGSKYAKSYLPYLFRSLALHTAGMVCPKTADFFSEYWQPPCLNACIYFTERGWITLKPTVYRSLHKCGTERLKKPSKIKQRLNILWATETTLLYQWFQKCARQTARDPPKKFPGDPWIRFCNGYFEVYLFFKLKEWRFVKNNRTSSLIGDMFICMTFRISS